MEKFLRVVGVMLFAAAFALFASSMWTGVQSNYAIIDGDLRLAAALKGEVTTQRWLAGGALAVSLIVLGLSEVAGRLGRR